MGVPREELVVSAEAAARIRRLYRQMMLRHKTQATLAEIFGVSQGTINKVVNEIHPYGRNKRTPRKPKEETRDGA